MRFPAITNRVYKLTCMQDFIRRFPSKSFVMVTRSPQIKKIYLDGLRAYMLQPTFTQYVMKTHTVLVPTCVWVQVYSPVLGLFCVAVVLFMAIGRIRTARCSNVKPISALPAPTQKLAQTSRPPGIFAPPPVMTKSTATSPPPPLPPQKPINTIKQSTASSDAFPKPLFSAPPEIVELSPEDPLVEYLQPKETLVALWNKQAWVTYAPLSELEANTHWAAKWLNKLESENAAIEVYCAKSKMHFMFVAECTNGLPAFFIMTASSFKDVSRMELTEEASDSIAYHVDHYRKTNAKRIAELEAENAAKRRVVKEARTAVRRRLHPAVKRSSYIHHK